MLSSGKNQFLIDGFPRNEDNLTGWNKAMEGKADVKLVLDLECPDGVRVN
jgi:UMP-CMP kinase